MVGGRAPKVTSEVLYRFEFPESPGALSRFLAALSGGWNVSLFHYRNHGSDFGRVLVAFQVIIVFLFLVFKAINRVILLFPKLVHRCHYYVICSIRYPWWFSGWTGWMDHRALSDSQSAGVRLE